MFLNNMKNCFNTLFPRAVFVKSEFMWKTDISSNGYNICFIDITQAYNYSFVRVSPVSPVSRKVDVHCQRKCKSQEEGKSGPDSGKS